MLYLYHRIISHNYHLCLGDNENMANERLYCCNPVVPNPNPSIYIQKEIPYSLKFSGIKYFAVWLNSAQKQNFADKIFVVERESRKVPLIYVRMTTSTKIFAG